MEHGMPQPLPTSTFPLRDHQLTQVNLTMANKSK